MEQSNITFYFSEKTFTHTSGPNHQLVLGGVSSNSNSNNSGNSSGVDGSSSSSDSSGKTVKICVLGAPKVGKTGGACIYFCTAVIILLRMMNFQPWWSGS